MTVNVVFFQEDDGDDCTRAIARWARDPSGLVGEGGPLASARLEPGLVKSVEVDVQTVRWPSTTRPDLGGHAEYLLRVFRRDANGELAPAPLENQPDVVRLARDRALRARLLDLGFYAPSTYFPLIVEEALMIEPTETESKETLDQFCDAMIQIAREAETSPDVIHQAPLTTPVRRLDQTLAARQPVLRWRPAR